MQSVKRDFSTKLKNIAIFLLISLLVVLISIIQFTERGHLPNDNKMPDTMAELSKEETVEWMAGIGVNVKSCTLQEHNDQTLIDLYNEGSSPLHVEVWLQNGLDCSQPYNLMVLADGVPIEFNIDGICYLSYSLSLSPKQTKLDLECTPDFTLSLGRLDFLLFYNGNPQSDFHMTTYTVFIEQSNHNMQASIPFQTTSEQREGLYDAFDNGAYGAWLWPSATLPMPSARTGSRELEIQVNEPFLFEAVASNPGAYRTILIWNNRPIDFIFNGRQFTYIDWESSKTNMLQIPIELPTPPTEFASFFSVSTPIGCGMESETCLASAKILINLSLDGAEE